MPRATVTRDMMQYHVPVIQSAPALAVGQTPRQWSDAAELLKESLGERGAIRRGEGEYEMGDLDAAVGRMIAVGAAQHPITHPGPQIWRNAMESPNWSAATNLFVLRGLFFHWASTGVSHRIIAAVASLLLTSTLAHSQTSVTTYHYDVLRTGWNQTETVLTPQNVATSLVQQFTVQLDGRVDAQPLVVPGVKVQGDPNAGTHDVVYVATQNDTVYAIDPTRGTVLKTNHLGTPVDTPTGCGDTPAVGINSTPVIDLSTNTIYVIAYTAGTPPQYTIYALDLSTLNPQTNPLIIPQQVSASHALVGGGKPFLFQPTYQRQRPGLLEANGNIYAGFSSFCDFNGFNSRGWVLGWQASTLTPLPANQLNDTQSVTGYPFYLSSVWMSGFGLASDASGSIYFATGNTTGDTYDPISNISESVVKLSSDLTTVQGLFTPTDSRYGISVLNGTTPGNSIDNDFGSGGVLLLPDQQGSASHVAVAAGKVGQMYLLNRDNLGGTLAEAVGPGNSGLLQTVGIGATERAPLSCVAGRERQLELDRSVA